MKKKQIIFFLANFGQGGAGKSIVNLCSKLNKKKYDIAILCLNTCYYKKFLNKNKIQVIEIKKKRVLFSQIEIKKIINKFIKKNKKVILISNLFYTNAIISLFIKKSKYLKLIFIERTPLQELNIYFGIIDFVKKIIIKLILRFNYNKADLIIANSKKTAKDINLFSKSNTVHIYPPAFKYALNSHKKKEKVIKMLTVGRLSKEKDYLSLLYFFSKLKDLNFSLKIIGEGPEKNNLINYIKNKNLSKKIQILSFKDNIKKYFLNSDLFISSSKFEGFPNTVVESISCNTPVLSAKSHGGIFEILKEKKFGLLYDSGNFNSFEKKINFFLKNRKKFLFSKRDVEKNFRKFNENYSCSEYEKVLDRF